MPLVKDYAFSSERLEYRGIERGDADLIVGWRSDPSNYKNFFSARPVTLEGHIAWFERYLGDPSRYDFMILEEGRPIGTCGLSSIADGACEASYMIGDVCARGKGYAVEALRAVSDVAFRELGVGSVRARILPGNEASIRVAERAGMGLAELVYSIAGPAAGER